MIRFLKCSDLDIKPFRVSCYVLLSNKDIFWIWPNSFNKFMIESLTVGFLFWAGGGLIDIQIYSKTLLDIRHLFELDFYQK